MLYKMVISCNDLMVFTKQEQDIGQALTEAQTQQANCSEAQHTTTISKSDAISISSKLWYQAQSKQDLLG